MAQCSYSRYSNLEVDKQFKSGAFVVMKTHRAFSCIALDHAHEQANVLVKGEGGAVGLTGNPNALRRWMLGGPELSRMVEEYEKGSSI